MANKTKKDPQGKEVLFENLCNHIYPKCEN